VIIILESLKNNLTDNDLSSSVVPNCVPLWPYYSLERLFIIPHARRSLRTTRFDVIAPHVAAWSHNQSDRFGFVITSGRDLSTSEALGGESRDNRPATDMRLSNILIPRAKRACPGHLPTYYRKPVRLLIFFFFCATADDRRLISRSSSVGLRRYDTNNNASPNRTRIEQLTVPSAVKTV